MLSGPDGNPVGRLSIGVIAGASGVIAGASIVLFMLHFDGNPTEARSDQASVAVVQPSITPTSIPATDLTQEPMANAVPDPVVPTTTMPEPRLASLSGSAWLSRTDGSSDLLRGLPVCLFPAKVPARAVYEQFQGKLESWAQYANRLKQECSAMEARYRAMPDYPKYRTEYQECRGRTASVEFAIEALAKFLNSLAGEPGITDIHKAFGVILTILIKLDLPPPERMQFLDAVSPLAVQRTTTGADGKYSFDSVRSGDYVLYAVIDTKALCAEWLLANQVSPGGAVLVDLSNQNTITLLNKHP